MYRLGQELAAPHAHTSPVSRGLDRGVSLSTRRVISSLGPPERPGLLPGCAMPDAATGSRPWTLDRVSARQARLCTSGSLPEVAPLEVTSRTRPDQSQSHPHHSQGRQRLAHGALLRDSVAVAGSTTSCSVCQPPQPSQPPPEERTGAAAVSVGVPVLIRIALRGRGRRPCPSRSAAAQTPPPPPSGSRAAVHAV